MMNFYFIRLFIIIVKTPDDTFGGDTCSRDGYVKVDGVTKDYLRKDSYRIIRVSFASKRIYCMKPFGSYDKYIYDPITRFALADMNYMGFKKSFKTQKELEDYLKESPIVGKKTGIVLSVENIVWNDDNLEENS